MGLLTFLKKIFVRAPRRDISRLATPGSEDGDATDSVHEVIDISGGPLKEKHRRRALRDKRLLPKKVPVSRQLRVTKRKNIFSREEADRLFSGTMRTRNRNLRDLLPDEEQLKRYGLPIWKTEDDVAAALGITRKQLWFFSTHREREMQAHYVTFAIPKRNGGKRLIMAPKRRLKALQRKLLELLVEKLPISEHAHGFRKGRNIRTGAEPHVGKQIVLRIDLKDFFPSVTFARVRGLLIAYGYSFPVATTLAVLMTEAERQPVVVDGKTYQVPIGHRHCVQGAPTSPGLCNAMVLRLDRRLNGLAKKRGFAYTRYADDLSFSGDFKRDTAAHLRIAVSRIIGEEGFSVNTAKTRIMGQGARQSVTNVVVNQVLGMSRQERRRLRAIAHRLRKGGEQNGKQAAKLEGNIAYLHMLNPAQAEKLETFYTR